MKKTLMVILMLVVTLTCFGSTPQISVSIEFTNEAKKIMMDYCYSIIPKDGDGKDIGNQLLKEVVLGACERGYRQGRENGMLEGVSGLYGELMKMVEEDKK